MERYTDCDIEVHLTDALAGMDTTGVDEDASNTKARQVVEDALIDTYPQHTVYVHMGRSYGRSVTVKAYPDGVGEEDIEQVVHDALDNLEAWVVEKAE